MMIHPVRRLVLSLSFGCFRDGPGNQWRYHDVFSLFLFFFVLADERGQRRIQLFSFLFPSIHLPLFLPIWNQ